MPLQNRPGQGQLLIFDLDGTLIDSRADLAAGINHMRAHYSLGELPIDTVSAYIGDGVRNLVKRSLQGAEVPFEEALQINKAYYNTHLAVHTTTYTGVCDGVKKLAAAGHELALLSNKPGDACRAIMKHFGLDGYFTAMIGGGDVRNLKPEPDGIFEILERTGLKPSLAWMIGDHHTDLAAANKARINSVYAEYGFGNKLDHDAKICFSSFSELVRYFVETTNSSIERQK